MAAGGGGGGGVDEAGCDGGGGGGGGCTCVGSISVGNIRVGLVCVNADSRGGSMVPSCTSNDDGKDVGAGTITVKSLSAKLSRSPGCRVAVFALRSTAAFRFSCIAFLRLLSRDLSLPFPLLHIAESSTMGPHIVAHWSGMLSGGSASPRTPPMNAQLESRSIPASDGFIVLFFFFLLVLRVGV